MRPKDRAFLCAQREKVRKEKIEKVLLQAGAGMKDVVRVRMFVTDISCWQDYGRAHSEFFKEIRPCNTMVQISALIGPEYMIEIEATAILP